MDIILSSDKCQFSLVYFDDIVIFSKSRDGHTDHVRPYLTLSNDARVAMKWMRANCFLIAEIILALSSSRDAWQLAHTQLTQFAAYRLDLILQSFVLSLAFDMSFAGSYQIFHGSPPLSTENCGKTSPLSAQSYRTSSLKC